MKIQDIDREWIKFNSDFTLLRSSMFTPSPTLTCRGQKMGISGVHHGKKNGFRTTSTEIDDIINNKDK